MEKAVAILAGLIVIAIAIGNLEPILNQDCSGNYSCDSSTKCRSGMHHYHKPDQLAGWADE